MILLIVLDGLRPDQITEDRTPNLCMLVRRGVRFLNHHSVFPTETRINVASFVTGCYPGRHGLVGNQFYFHYDKETLVDSSRSQSLALLNRATNGNILFSKSLGEYLGETGKRFVCINVGSSGNAYLNNHKVEETNGMVIHPNYTFPTSEEKILKANFGNWPVVGIPNSARIRYATDVLLDYVIPNYEPTVAFLWMSEPDGSQHKTGLDSCQADESIHNADRELGRVLEFLEDKKLTSSTDFLVASDHGHSTVTKTVNISKQLVEAGLKDVMESDEVLLAGKGGCTLIYVQKHNKEKVKAIIEFLMTQDWCGPLFTSPIAFPGTFPLSLIMNQNDRSPDILMSFAWNDLKEHGFKGTITAAKGEVGVGCGNHGSISPYDIHNVLIASGPHFKQGVEDNIPTGNIDILPTLLNIMELPPPKNIDGRILSEVLKGEIHLESSFVERRLQEASTHIGESLPTATTDVTSWKDILF
ncbi:MAG: hypothetical protein QG670_873 [Thermoproteota archaeon]|nr:hypothetical protein [Thermoproteota archaeon]